MAKSISNQDNVSAFSLTLGNQANTLSAYYRMFDADGVCAAIGSAMTAPTLGTITPAAITATTNSTPIVLSGFNYQTSSDPSQFAEPFDITRGSIDGRIVKHPNIIAKAKRNTQFDANLLTIDERFVIDGQTCIEVNVIASEKVTMTFFVEGFLV
tara:strand:- start:258 stop:722 length:465 start_codon:yes stop_codon:yes gene_type:complete